MKTIQISMIIFSFILISIVSNVAFGSEPCPPSGYIHYGPSRQSVPCYLVSLQPNLTPTLEQLYGNPVTQIDYHDTKLIAIDKINKTTFRMGENVTVIPELTNIGTQNVTIGYMPPLFDTEVKDQNGTKVWPPDLMGVKLTVGFGMTLKPNMSSPDHTFQDQTSKEVFTLYSPGNYTITSVASFSRDQGRSNIALWSKPLQITVLPERYYPMLLMVESAPTTLELMPPQERQIHLRFINASTNGSIKDVVFAMNVTKGYQTFLQNTFWTQSGSFTLNLKPEKTYLWDARPDHDPMDGLYYSKGDQIDIATSYLTEDTYHFSIIPISGYQVGHPSSQTGEKFETDLNLLSVYNKTLTPEVIPEFPLTIPVLLISIMSIIVFYRIRFRK